LKWLSEFVEVFDGGLVFGGKHEMKLQKCTHQTQHYEIYYKTHNNMQFDGEFGVVG